MEFRKKTKNDATYQSLNIYDQSPPPLLGTKTLVRHECILFILVSIGGH